MALAFILIGVALLVAAFRNTQGQLGTLIAGDFTGSSSFLDWIAVVAIVGMAGYMPALRTPSRYFMGLILLVVFLTKGTGFFSQLHSAIKNPVASTTAAPVQATPTTGIPVSLSAGSGTAASGAGSAVSSATGAASALTSFAGFL